MYFHLLPSIHLTYFNDEIIVLDLPKDRYILLTSEIATIVSIILSHEFTKDGDTYQLVSSSATLPDDFDQKLAELRTMGILSSDEFELPQKVIIRKNQTESGVENIDWRMCYGDLTVPVSKKMVLQAYYLRIKVEFALKWRGFAGLVSMIKKTPKQNRVYRVATEDEYNRLATIINRACFYYPYRTKCLEWAVTFTMLALRQGLKCNLVVGVQNMPFLAHAWGQVDDIVIADSQDLPRHLSVILSVPFDVAE